MKIAFLGDMALIGKYDLINNRDAKQRLRIMSQELKKYDYVIANLESPLTNIDKTLICKSMHLKSNPINIELIKYLHIDAVSLANNHIYDYGKKGMFETIDVLERNNIKYFGLDNKSLSINLNGEKINISAFCCYSTNGSGYGKNSIKNKINTLTYKNIEEQIEINKKNHEFSIFCFHWGDEHTNYPRYDHIKLARHITSKTNAIICGHHPHIIQGIETINSSIIAYSLGNFCFDTCISKNGKIKVDLNDDNKKSFIFCVDIECGKVIDYKSIGIVDSEDCIDYNDLNEKIENISKQLINISNLDIYQRRRLEQINAVHEAKFGEKDFHWLISRLNFSSVGAFILSKFRTRKYKRYLGDYLK